MSYKSKYTGAQVDSLLGKCDELDRLSGVTMPLYMEGSPWVANNGFLGGAGAEVEIPKSSSPLTLTASDTGLKKKVFDRFMAGVPCCLLVPVLAGPSDMTVITAVPFTLLNTSRMTAARTLSLSYRCATYMSGREGSNIDINVTVNTRTRTVTLSRSETEREAVPDTEPLLPFALDHFTINADGSVAPTGAAVTFDESSTGDLGKLHDRVQKGTPPAMGVWMTNSDGSRTLVWAYLDQVAASGKTKIYMSGSLANGTFSGKHLRVNLTNSRIQCSMLTASTT